MHSKGAVVADAPTTAREDLEILSELAVVADGKGGKERTMSILAFRESRWRRAVASVLAVLMLFFQSTPILAQDVMAPPTAPEMGGRQQVAVTNPLAKSYDLVDAETEDIQNDA